MGNSSGTPADNVLPALKEGYGNTDVDERKLMRKIDFRVMPILFIVYVASFLDRVNMGNALTMSMPVDLGLTGQQPNIALTIFFIPYILFEIPSNIFLRKLSPHVWISACVLTFGVVMLCQGFVQNFSGILVTRFFLGLAEAGVFPGSFYLISFWYKREEAQKRFTVYWCSIIVAGAFGGLLASAIANMDGLGQMANWRWLFILEGIGTIMIGIAAFFLIADFPDECRWLTAAERDFVLRRTMNSETQHRPVTLKDVAHFFTDFKNILAAITYFAFVAPIYSFTYFAPTIINTLGYSVVQTQLHSVPPMAASLAFSLLIAYLSDKFRIRFPFIIAGSSLIISGLAILMTVHGKDRFSAQYAGIHLVTMGAFSAGAVVVCWYLMNLQGHIERSIGSAWLIGFGNLGGIVATFSFLKADAPNYQRGYSMCMAVSVVGVVAATGYAAMVWMSNKKIQRRTSGEKPLSL